MYFHVVQPFLKPLNVNFKVDLVDIEFTEYNHILEGGTDLKLITPYPNKRYLIATRKSAPNNTLGFLIKLESGFDKITTVTRYCINQRNLLTHTVEYTLADTEHPTISNHSPLLTQIFSNLIAKSKTPDTFLKFKQIYQTSNIFMEAIDPKKYGENHHPDFEADDIQDDNGLILQRRQKFTLPTFNYENYTRLNTSFKLPKKPNFSNVLLKSDNLMVA